ncbi:unnamed protein product [Heterosigma akashiwo]|uniref:Extradiol ring-cleavage dioxygenase class III enzyme subunit B domain-containing protein n=1 Tax=Heterosigma akashiwo TaxID=2829 RepID=A0A6V1P6U3_HETAK
MERKQPVLFLSHGAGPFPITGARGHETLQEYFKNIEGEVQTKPSAIIIVSAHWETTSQVSISCGSDQGLMFDYSNFPPETYTYEYKPPVPDETLLEEIARDFDVPHIQNRGFDHGVFVPLLLAFPNADIPVIQLSMLSNMDPSTHLDIGAKLEKYRDEDGANCLIVGSGMTFHNFGRADPGAAVAFDGFLSQAVTGLAGSARRTALAGWERAPGARAAHAREEHLMPLLVAAGAAGGDAGRTTWREEGFLGGYPVACYRFGGAAGGAA